MGFIVVTGFGPFVGTSGKDGNVIRHDKNASWEAVKHLASNWKAADHEVELRVEEIEVSYSACETATDRIWDTSDVPLFVIHVGVAGKRDSIDLEVCSRNGSYCLKDVLGHVGCRDHEPDNPTVVSGPDVLKTDIDVMGCLADCPPEFKCNVSDDPGNYLCGYIYYRSLLKVNELQEKGMKTSALFIHVPVESTTPAPRVAKCLEAICTHLIRTRN